MTQNAQLDELLELVKGMSTRLETLESEVAALKGHQPGAEIPDDVLMAICAAVSAYLGNRAKVKAVRFSRGPAWTQQGRRDVQHHVIPHVR